MNLHSILRPQIVIAALLTLLPLFVAGFAPQRVAGFGQRLPKSIRFAAPASLCVPYLLVATSFGVLRWEWLLLYALLPVTIVLLLDQARAADSDSRGNWRDYLVLVVLGLAVDLRWFEPAWPRGYSALGKMLLLDAGIFGFLAVRRLDGVGFDLRLKLRDVGVGLREFCLYAVIAIPLGLGLDFLHFHPIWPRPLDALGAFVFTFFLIAIPEELFFRGWMQNLLERRIGRMGALVVTAVIFGLSHWNKRTASFNWQYVLMAAIAGVFYGRAWRAQRRVGVSSITHATVDSLWSLWLR
jgi:membrane protease YdiL (CAAX protease family)